MTGLLRYTSFFPEDAAIKSELTFALHNIFYGWPTVVGRHI
jgi:hypothetical protein